MDKTKNEIQSLCVIGSGAVGSFYGSKLQSLGLRTEFQSKSLFLNGVSHLQIKSIWGDFRSVTQVHKSTKTMQKSDLILVSTKVTNFDEDFNYLIHSLYFVCHKDSIILLLQNGINMEEKIQEIFPNNPVLGGLAFTCINRISLNEIHHIDYGTVKIGSTLKDNDSFAHSTVQLFQRAGIKSEYLPNLRLGRYEKLLWNIPFNSLSVIFHSTTDELVKSGTSLELAKLIMNDVYKIAKKEKLPVSKKMLNEMIQRTIAMKPYKTSMLLDFEAKRKLEVESIIGEPLRIAKKLKVKVSYIESIYYILKHLENQSI